MTLQELTGKGSGLIGWVAENFVFGIDWEGMQGVPIGWALGDIDSDVEIKTVPPKRINIRDYLDGLEVFDIEGELPIMGTVYELEEFTVIVPDGWE